MDIGPVMKEEDAGLVDVCWPCIPQKQEMSTVAG